MKVIGRATNPKVLTASTQASFRERARHANELRAALDQGFGHLLAGNKVSTGGRNQPQGEVMAMAQSSQVGG